MLLAAYNDLGDAMDLGNLLGQKIVGVIVDGDERRIRRARKLSRGEAAGLLRVP
jgi:hypothetical protein